MKNVILPTAFLLFYVLAVAAQAPEQPQPEFVKQARQLMDEGKPEAALGVYQQELKTSPDSEAANLGAGTVLDLMGKGEEARKYFTHAMRTPRSPEGRMSALRAMAMSYAFESNCPETVEYEEQIYSYYGARKDYFRQGEIADEMARVCLESGRVEAAARWYKIGHDTGLQEPNITPARRDLWDFRWEHAQARIAARKGDNAAAEKHVAAAKAILDKGTNPEQAQFFPYLKGYVEFYGGDYKAALADLKQANQNDPFIQCLMAQTYEKLGDQGQAMEFYKKAAAATSHNPAAAYAVPIARKKLASEQSR